MSENQYDKKDTVRQIKVMRAGPMKLAAFTVRDPETGEHGSLQYHMTYDNHVMALMSESAAKILADFVNDFAKPEPFTKWRDISTAPLDGTRVDLWAYRGELGENGIREGERYSDCCFARASFGTEPFGEPRWLGLNDRYIKVTPTHWMPLPEAPKSEA